MIVDKKCEKCGDKLRIIGVNLEESPLYFCKKCNKMSQDHVNVRTIKIK